MNKKYDFINNKKIKVGMTIEEHRANILDWPDNFFPKQKPDRLPLYRRIWKSIVEFLNKPRGRPQRGFGAWM